MLTNSAGHNKGGDQVNGSQECTGQVIVPGRDGAELFELAHEALHAVPLSIESLVMPYLFHAITPCRNHRLDFLFSEAGTDFVAVIGLVHNRRFHRTSFRYSRENCAQYSGVMLLPGCQHDTKRRLFICRRQVDLARETASASAQPLLALFPFFAAAPAACWCARTMVLSTNS